MTHRPPVHRVSTSYYFSMHGVIVYISQSLSHMIEIDLNIVNKYYLCTKKNLLSGKLSFNTILYDDSILNQC